MGRPKRSAPGGWVYHVLSRANLWIPVFTKDEDFIAFERVPEEAVARTGTRLLSYCLMGITGTWSCGPRKMMSCRGCWLVDTDAHPALACSSQVDGVRAIVSGAIQSFPVQDDDYFLTVCQYVERNALRANLVMRADDSLWSSLYRWCSGTAEEKASLSAWPLRRSAGWLAHVNSPQTAAELAAIRRSVNRGSPFGDET